MKNRADSNFVEVSVVVIKVSISNIDRAHRQTSTEHLILKFLSNFILTKMCPYLFFDLLKRKDKIELTSFFSHLYELHTDNGSLICFNTD